MYLHNDFDRNLDKNFNRITGLAIFGWIVFALVDLAILAGIVYAAIHFLGKVW